MSELFFGAVMSFVGVIIIGCAVYQRTVTVQDGDPWERWVPIVLGSMGLFNIAIGAMVVAASLI